MSVAVTIDAREALPSAAVATGTVLVRTFGFAHCAAACSCGWHGSRRRLKAAAEQDAWMHAIHQRCVVAVPLVRPASTG
ncbi:hypothetical protein ABGB19_13790 [Mycobacterium sp. B14F4]|uniref:hypothetical protein n=1 Tax=Mycobacterium sp. B14F4 TaxID=3153565 RepID=UPI00325CA91F